MKAYRERMSLRAILLSIYLFFEPYIRLCQASQSRLRCSVYPLISFDEALISLVSWWQKPATNIFNGGEFSSGEDDRSGVGLRALRLFQQLPIARMPDMPHGRVAGPIRHRRLREGLLLLPPLRGAARD